MTDPGRPWDGRRSSATGYRPMDEGRGPPLPERAAARTPCHTRPAEKLPGRTMDAPPPVAVSPDLERAARRRRVRGIGLVGPAPPWPLAQSNADDPPRELREDDLTALTWRSVGPANMSGRVAAIAVEPGNPRTFYIGYATGGVWKTTNGGTTYKPIFDRYETSSIGSIAVAHAPTDWPGWDATDVPEDERAEKGKGRIIWVGTGEGNGRELLLVGARRLSIDRRRRDVRAQGPRGLARHSRDRCPSG
jgi:hypothetical protein